MGSHYEAPIRAPLVTGNKSYHQITVDVARPIEGSANKQWWIVFIISFFATVFPHSAIGSKKGNIENFLSLKQELVETKKN